MTHRVNKAHSSLLVPTAFECIVPQCHLYQPTIYSVVCMYVCKCKYLVLCTVNSLNLVFLVNLAIF